MTTLHSQIYSQDKVKIDDNVGSLFDLQFSEFYQNFKNHNVISNFIKYRYATYIKYLDSFKPTSSSFPTLIQYNFGLDQVIDLSIVSNNSVTIHDLITKRGTISVFNEITNSLGIHISNEDILLISQDPVRIIGSDTLKSYPSGYLNYFQDLDLINEEDYPVKLPIISLSYDIQLRVFDKYDTIIKSLLFDDPEIIKGSVKGVPLKQYLISYLILRQIIYNRYYQRPLQAYEKFPLITPVSFLFNYFMELKYPNLLELTPSERSHILLQIKNDYIVYKTQTAINSSNDELNEIINNDLNSGMFITDLNKFVQKRINSTVEFNQFVYSSQIHNKQEYFNYFNLLANAVKYLKNDNDSVIFYANIIKYLHDNFTKVYISDFSDICITIQTTLNNLGITENLPIVLPPISLEKTAQVLKTDLINYYPLYMSIPDPSYNLKFSSSMSFVSALQVYTDPSYHIRHKTLGFVDVYHHVAKLIKEAESFKLEDVKHHIAKTVIEYQNIHIDDHKFEVTFHVYYNNMITLDHKPLTFRTLIHKNNLINLKLLNSYRISSNSKLSNILFNSGLQLDYTINESSNINLLDLVYDEQAINLSDIIELYDEKVRLDIGHVLYENIELDQSSEFKQNVKVSSNTIIIDETFIQKLPLESTYFFDSDIQGYINIQSSHDYNLLSTFGVMSLVNENDNIKLTDSNVHSDTNIIESDNLSITDNVHSNILVKQNNNVSLIDSSKASINVSEDTDLELHDDDFTITEE